jgi:SulP family sulfate permease
MDATGLHALEEFHDKCRRDGTVLVLSGVRPSLQATFRKVGFDHRIGTENILPHIDAALTRARSIVGDVGPAGSMH